MAESTMPIEVHADVVKSFAKEYVEAVITDAMKILPLYQHRQDTPVMGLSLGPCISFSHVHNTLDLFEQCLGESFLHHPVPLD